MRKQTKKLCPLDGKEHSIGDCYGGECSNEQYSECYPPEEGAEKIV